MNPAKSPERMCVGCGKMKPKTELVRVVKTAEGEISLDRTGKKNGRGAYICDSAECFLKAQKARRFEKAFRGTVPQEVYEALERELLL